MGVTALQMSFTAKEVGAMAWGVVECRETRAQGPYLMELSNLKARRRLARRSSGGRSPDQLPGVGWVDSGALTVTGWLPERPGQG